MKLAELSHEQQVAVVALIELITMADGVVTEEEENEIGHMAEELGEEAYRELVDEVDDVFASPAGLKSFLLTVRDREAQELIYGTVLEEAVMRAPPSQVGSEMLDWMARTWDIHTETVPDEDPDE